MEEKKAVKSLSRELVLAIIMLCILMISITSATFAWFSGNKKVDTTHVSARTGTELVELQISKSMEEFIPEENCPIVQINSTDISRLLPVSTADLRSFVYDKGNVLGQAIAFDRVEDEERYYHGRVYLRAKSDISDNSKMAIYLEQSAGATGEDNILSAARLGLVFDNNADSAVIFMKEHNIKQSNTIYDGKPLEAGLVLGMTVEGVKTFPNPAVFSSEYSVVIDGEESRLPGKELFIMELNKIYPVDIYFYLEGCDGDCTESISLEEVELGLAFYGVLTD